MKIKANAVPSAGGTALKERQLAVSAFLYKGHAVYTLRNCRIGFVCAYLDGFKGAVMLVVKVVLAGRYIAVNTWILSHG